MQLEVRLPITEIEQLVRQFVPLQLNLDEEEAGRTLFIDELTFIHIAPGSGIALGIEGRIRWPLLGLSVPVKLKAVELLVHFGLKREPSSTLTIGLTIEKADLAWVPDRIDKKITERIQKELREKPIEVGWDFEQLLSHRFPLPDTLRSAEALRLLVDSSDFRITSDSLILNVTVGTRVDARLLPKAESAE